MRTGRMVLLAALFALSLAAEAREGKRDRAKDEGAIRDLASQVQAAWNAHDPRALASLYTEDATLINPAGRQAGNRKEIERLFRDVHQGPEAPMRDTTARVQVERIHWLAPDIALVDVRQEVREVRMPEGETQDMNFLVTSIAKRDGDRWRLQHVRVAHPIEPIEVEPLRGG